MTRNQIKIAAEILIYLRVFELEKMPCESEEERDIVAKALEMVEAKVSNYPVVPEGNLNDIITYVRDNY